MLIIPECSRHIVSPLSFQGFDNFQFLTSGRDFSLSRMCIFMWNVKRGAELIKQGRTFGLDQMVRCCEGEGIWPKTRRTSKAICRAGPTGRNGKILCTSEMLCCILHLLRKELSLFEVREASSGSGAGVFLPSWDVSASSFLVKLLSDWSSYQLEGSQHWSPLSWCGPPALLKHLAFQ